MARWTTLIDRLEGAYAPSTIRNYRQDFAGFMAWCRRHRLCSLPAEAATIAKYIDAHAPHLKASTIKRKLAAVRKLHQLAGHGNVVDDENIRLALRRAVRARPTRPSQALGVTASLRDRLIAASGDDLAGLRDRVLVAVGFDTLCRRSELVAIRIEDFNAGPNGSCSVLIRRAKNDAAGNGRTAHLSAEAAKLVDTWIHTIDAQSGPLLRPVYKSKAPSRFLAPSAVGRILKALAEKACLDANEVTKISGHSLRVGGAQELTLRGFGILPIMSAGGWKTMNVVARYVENVSLNPWDTPAAR